MDGCMVSRSNRFCVRISVPDPALVCLQVAFGMCCYDWPPVSANNSELSVVAVRERSMPSDQICSFLVKKARKAPLKSFFTAAELPASLRRIALHAERLQEDLGSHSLGAYSQPIFPAKTVITGEVSWIRIDIVSTHDH